MKTVRMQRWAKSLCVIGMISLMTLLLAGCKGNIQAPNPMALGTVDREVVAGPEEFERLQLLNRQSELKGGGAQINYIRIEAVRDTAMSIGARSALAWRANQINRMLQTQANRLDAVFNFQGLVLNESIMPPVLLESRQSLTVDNPQTLRVADRSYQILKQAHFVTAPPTWRQYLFMDETRPEEPDVSLLPATDEERKAWQEGIIKGWEEGLKQATMIYDENLNRLKRDYQGMVRYRMLLAQNMVSAPQVAHRDLGITGGGEALAVNDRILTIKALPSLKANSQEWKPSIAP